MTTSKDSADTENLHTCPGKWERVPAESICGVTGEGTACGSELVSTLEPHRGDLRLAEL